MLNALLISYAQRLMPKRWMVTMELSPWLITANLVWESMQEIKRLEEHKSVLLEQLKVLSNNQSRMEAPFSFKKDERNGSIDYAKIEVLKGINLELYRKPKIEYWKLDKI